MCGLPLWFLRLRVQFLALFTVACAKQPSACLCACLHQAHLGHRNLYVLCAGSHPPAPSTSSSLPLPPDNALLGSNVYSVPESCLLAWASVHFARTFGKRARRWVVLGL